MLKAIFKLLNDIKTRQVANPAFPANIMFFVTNRCNARCPHCFYWKNLNHPEGELSLEEIKKMAGAMSPTSSVGITGGEPTLREDLLEICLVFIEKAKNLTISSNGMLPEILYSVLKAIPKGRCNIYLNLSIEGPREVHDRFRGEGSFDKVMRTIELVKELKGVKVILVTTLTRLNSDKIEELIDLVAGYKLEHRFNIARGVDNALFDLDKDVTNDHSPKDPGNIFLTTDEIESAYLKLLELNRKRCFWPPFQQTVMEYSLKILKERRKVLECFAGRLEGVIYPNGDVALCEFTKPFANVRDFGYDFNKLWRSARALDARKSIKSCYCLHSCNISTALGYDSGFLYREMMEGRSIFQKAKILANYAGQLLRNMI